MNRRKKVTFVAGGAAIAALVVGLGAAGAIAASRMLSPSEESKAVIDDAAAQLGVKPQALSDALKQALKNRVDEAVDAGNADQGRGREDQGADRLRRVPAALRPWRRPRWARVRSSRPLRDPRDRFSYLGMSEADLRAALDDQTLADIAKKKGKSVSGLVKALVAAEEKKIDEAVADGRITKAQASELKSKLTERMQALVNGELGEHRRTAGTRILAGTGLPASATSIRRPAGIGRHNRGSGESLTLVALLLR